ncbi:MAG: hypothetical protein ACRC37_00630 [Lentisphaeria bacterium]
MGSQLIIIFKLANKILILFCLFIAMHTAMADESINSRQFDTDYISLLNLSISEVAWGDGKIDQVEAVHLLSCLHENSDNLSLAMIYEILEQFNSLDLLNDVAKLLASKNNTLKKEYTDWFTVYKQMDLAEVSKTVNISDWQQTRKLLALLKKTVQNNSPKYKINSILRQNRKLVIFSILWSLNKWPESSTYTEIRYFNNKLTAGSRNYSSLISQAFYKGTFDNNLNDLSSFSFDSKYSEMDIGIAYEIINKYGHLQQINDFSNQLSEKFLVSASAFQYWFDRYKKISTNEEVIDKTVENFLKSEGAIELRDYRVLIAVFRNLNKKSLTNKQVITFLKRNPYLSEFFYFWLILDKPEFLKSVDFSEVAVFLIQTVGNYFSLKDLYASENDFPFREKWIKDFELNPDKDGEITLCLPSLRATIHNCIDDFDSFQKWFNTYKTLSKQGETLEFFYNGTGWLPTYYKFITDIVWLFFLNHSDLSLPLLNKVVNLSDRDCYASNEGVLTLKYWLTLVKTSKQHQALFKTAIKQIRVYCVDNSNKIRQLNALHFLADFICDEDIELLSTLISEDNFSEKPLLALSAVHLLNSLQSDSAQTALQNLSKNPAVHQVVREALNNSLKNGN